MQYTKANIIFISNNGGYIYLFNIIIAKIEAEEDSTTEKQSCLALFCQLKSYITY